MERQSLLNHEIEQDDGDLDEASLPPTIPLGKQEEQVNLEGGDWLLTTLLITVDALLVTPSVDIVLYSFLTQLSIYQSADTRWATFLTWFIDFDCGDGWSCRLADTLFIMVVAIVNVTLLIPIINVNVRTPSKTCWRFWLLSAWLSLLLLDTMTVLQFVDSIKKCIDGEDIESWTAHFCLVASAMVITLILNFRFLYLYRFLSFLTCSEDETLQKTPGLVQIYNLENGVDLEALEGNREYGREISGPLHIFKPPQLKRFDTVKFVEEMGRGINTLVMMKTRLARVPAFRKLERSASALSDLSFVRRVRESAVASRVHHAKCYLSTRISEAYHQVAEVDNAFEYSSWMKAAAVFTVLMLFYNCIKTTEVVFSLTSSWDRYHILALRFQDGLYNVSASLEDVYQNLTDVSQSLSSSADQESAIAFLNATLPEALSEVEALQETLETYEKGRGKAYDLAGAMLDIALLTTAKLVNITDLKGNAVVSAFFYVDSIIPIIKYTCVVGYPIGTIIGLHSLYQVLVQHKRMSMGLEQALTAKTSFSANGVLDFEGAKLSLLGIEQKYHIGGAVYFFGILMSTAVVQQHIFGFLSTMILAIVINLKNFDVLLNIGGYLIFVYLVVLITNFFVTHVIGDRLLTREGYQIRHPWCFFLYLFTFSMIHAVLGFLYALWRALLLLITTFWVLNRLDVSLFLAGKQLDNGHYSFMSMLLLTRVIRLTNIRQGYIQDSVRTERRLNRERGMTTDLSGRNSDETNNEQTNPPETEVGIDNNE